MLSLSAKYLSPAINRVSDLIVKSAYGCWLETEENGKVLDFTSGIGAFLITVPLVSSASRNHPAGASLLTIMDCIRKSNFSFRRPL